MIYALTVGKNEEHRYLKPMLEAAAETFDAVFFYDDRSDDLTASIAAEYATIVVERPHEVPSFLEHEGFFRQGAWNAFQKALGPQEGDWVFVIDCDECLVGSKNIGVKEALHHVVHTATTSAINITIPEVFGFENAVPQVRVDGLWGTIFAPRLFEYKGHGSYALQHFGVPAVPTYVMAAAKEGTDLIQLLHYGYAARGDRWVKYQRYHGQAGHASAHVESIMDTPTLVPWVGCFDARMRCDGDS